MQVADRSPRTSAALGFSLWVPLAYIDTVYTCAHITCPVGAESEWVQPGSPSILPPILRYWGHRPLFAVRLEPGQWGLREAWGLSLLL